LHVNATKIHDHDHETLEYFIKNYPDDPIGIKNTKNTENTVFLRYPYDKGSLEKSFTQLNSNIDLKDIRIKPRETAFHIKDIKTYPIILQKIIKAYLDFDY